MKIPLITMISVIALGVLYVLIPVAANTYRRFHRRRGLRCPETGGFAEVDIDAHHAARSSAFGRMRLRIKNCTLWPKRKGCAERCLKSVQ